MNKDLEKIQELNKELKLLKDKFEIEIENKIKDKFQIEVECNILDNMDEIYIEGIYGSDKIRFYIDKQNVEYTPNTHKISNLLYDFVYKLAFE